MYFFICVSNVDNHLRNHGFILHMNPVAADVGLKLNISKSDNSQDLLLAKEVAKYFRIKPSKVEALIQEVVDAVKGWRKEASTIGITISEQNRMARTFRIVDGRWK